MTVNIKDAVINKIKSKVRWTDPDLSYKQLLKERQELIESTCKEIQKRIEKVCRQQTRVVIEDLGFNQTSSHLYESSWQEDVVKMLEMDGYKCIMNFNYSNGQSKTSLTVCWE